MTTPARSNRKRELDRLTAMLADLDQQRAALTEAAVKGRREIKQLEKKARRACDKAERRIRVAREALR